MRNVFKPLLFLTISGLAACNTLPSSPSLLVLPGSGKNFDQFRGDDYYCRQYATGQIGGEVPAQVANSSAVGSAIAGTAVGAAAGAAFGGGQGAAIGAGSGLVVGSLAGSSNAGYSYYDTQQRFDMAYIQCMYAQGHRVPVSGQITDDRVNSRPVDIPPPPPGNPPPPPPR